MCGWTTVDFCNDYFVDEGQFVNNSDIEDFVKGNKLSSNVDKDALEYAINEIIGRDATADMLTEDNMYDVTVFYIDELISYCMSSFFDAVYENRV